MRGLITACVLLVSLGISAAKAAPVAIVGGDTRVLVTADLAGLGLTPSLQGSTSVQNGALNFPITGGELDGIAGQLLHEGSGVFLSDGTDSVFAGNFIIDTVAETIFGDVVLNGSTNVGDDLPLFSFNAGSVTVPELLDLDNPSLALLITSTLAGALTNVFGAPDLAGAQFGLAATDPIPTPIPGAIWLFAAGAAGLAATRRRRKTA